MKKTKQELRGKPKRPDEDSKPGTETTEGTGQTGGSPGQTGSTPGQSGMTPGQSGNTPGHGGAIPGQTGNTPGQSGMTPGHQRKEGVGPGIGNRGPDPAAEQDDDGWMKPGKKHHQTGKAQKPDVG